MSQYASINPAVNPSSGQNSVIKDIINTPYMKVLTILNEAKRFINIVSKTQGKWIRDLEWSIKVIASQSLYTFELADSEILKKVQQENPSFKQFIDFVSDYNKEVIEVNKKSTFWISQSQKMNNEIGWWQTPSFKIKRKLMNGKKLNYGHKFSGNELNFGMVCHSNSNNNKISVKNLKQIMKNMDNIHFYSPLNLKERKNNFEIMSLKKIHTTGNTNTTNKKGITLTRNNLINQQQDTKIKSNQRFHTPGNHEPKLQKYSFMYIESIWGRVNYDTKLILTKDFDIFELKELVGHSNVWPLWGRTIIEAFGINNKMINTSKLDSFLVSVSNGYISSVLYHNSIHGADVTHTVSQFFLNSNAEEVTSTSMWDILSIIIASLGHDIGHPGLTNNFQINSGSEIALAHNDLSCLENYHCTIWFKIERIPDNNIFETWSWSDYKALRKRIISMILATDMANHGKVMSVISAIVPKDLTIKDGEKMKWLSNDNAKQFSEKQALLDYFLHAADWAHNTKKFEISLQWVELLSKEFWNQGDKEKKMNLPVSFWCDRVGCDVPASQVGFINGFIIPTFDVLVRMFPSLNFMMDNAKDNCQRWQELVKNGEKLGWKSRVENDEEKKEERVTNNININTTVSNDNCHGMSQFTNSLNVSNNNSRPVIAANWGKPKFLMVQKMKNEKIEIDATSNIHTNSNSNNNTIPTSNVNNLQINSINSSPTNITTYNPLTKSMNINMNTNPKNK